MGYYMRYFVTSPEPPTLAEIDKALQAINTSYELKKSSGKRPSADVYLDEEVYGELEINQPGDGLFKEEIGEKLDELADITDTYADEQARIERVLRSSTAIIAVRVLWGGRHTEETLDGLDPIWGWLMENYAGLLQADDEGYYDSDGLVLEVG